MALVLTQTTPFTQVVSYCKVRQMTNTVYIFPHNDLSNLAHHHLAMINDKVANNNQSGISLDCMSCLIALAFSVEALINFVGFKCVSNWRERARFDEKIESLRSAIGLQYDTSSEPYTAIERLKTIRNEMAHAKPVERQSDAQSFDQLRNDMKTPWDEFSTPEFAKNSYQQLADFEKELLRLSGISVYDSVTRGFGSWDST